MRMSSWASPLPRAGVPPTPRARASTCTRAVCPSAWCLVQRPRCQRRWTPSGSSSAWISSQRVGVVVWTGLGSGCRFVEALRIFGFGSVCVRENNKLILYGGVRPLLNLPKGPILNLDVDTIGDFLHRRLARQSAQDKTEMHAHFLQ
ncbi:hypothetical protein B0H12DRAFT_435644 [Mycena haematopus]|nr:hypothetical protein B0H12DRAFT_435644 [Mycena haematopus]